VSTTLVYVPSGSGDHITLDWAPNDPANVNADNPPGRLVIDRVPPPPMLSVGKWQAIEFTSDQGQAVSVDACLDVGNGTWQKFALSLVVDASHVLDESFVVSRFSDMNCANKTGEDPSTLQGVLEESAGRLQAWVQAKGAPGANRSYDDFALTVPAADHLRLTRTTCRPMPDCAGGPAGFLFARVP
jgi:hypothetical protein